MRCGLQLIALLAAAGGEAPMLSGGDARRAAPEVVLDDGGVRRVEHWSMRPGKAPRLRDVTEQRPGRVLEGRDTDGDGRIDEEEITTFSDAGAVETRAMFSYPTDGGHAGRQQLSTALGGNRRHIDELYWRDGGWVNVRSFDSTWRDEKHLR